MKVKSWKLYVAFLITILTTTSQFTHEDGCIHVPPHEQVALLTATAKLKLTIVDSFSGIMVANFVLNYTNKSAQVNRPGITTGQNSTVAALIPSWIAPIRSTCSLSPILDSGNSYLNNILHGISANEKFYKHVMGICNNLRDLIIIVIDCSIQLMLKLTQQTRCRRQIKGLAMRIGWCERVGSTSIKC